MISMIKKIINQGKKVLMIRNYRTSYSPKNTNLTRLWLEKAVLRAGNFTPGEGLVISVEEGYVRIKVAAIPENSTHKVHHRKGEPLLDVCNREVDSVLGVGVKIDVVVKEKELYIYKEMSFDMLGKIEPASLDATQKKFKVISLFCGGGGMTSGFVNTQACESVFAVDSDIPEQNPYDYETEGKTPAYMSWTIETFRKNFPSTTVYWGDIRSVNPLYIPKGDIVIISPPCVEYSNLGGQMMGLVEHFKQHIVRIVLQSGAFAVFFENVPNYFKSKTFDWIRNALSPVFPEWHVDTIDSYDYGSIENRTRGYAVAFRDKTSFEFPQPVKIPESRRKKISSYLEEVEDTEWRPVEGTVMESFLTSHRDKFAHTGFTTDNNKMLVQESDKKVNCFVKGYSKIQSVCNYLQHPKDAGKWRMFRPTEILRMMNYPDWFKFPEEAPNTRKYEVLGNSVNIRSIEAIASNIVSAMMEYLIKKEMEKNMKQPCLFCV